MKTKFAMVLAGVVLLVGQSFAGNGDLIVDGRLGIGTSTPNQKIEAREPGGGYFIFNATDGAIEMGSSNDHISYIDFHGSANLGTDFTGRIKYVDGDGANIKGGFEFVVNKGAATPLRLLESGYVGVGNSDPKSRLDVGGYVTTDALVETKGLVDLARGIKPIASETATYEAEGRLVGGGPTFVGYGAYWEAHAGETFTIDTGITGVQQLVAVTFASHWRASITNMPVDYKIETSSDGTEGSWVAMDGMPAGGFTGNTKAAVIHYFTSPRDYRYVRLTILQINPAVTSAKISNFRILSARGSASYGNSPWMVTMLNNTVLATTGKVGIGTNNPAYDLDVQGTIGSNNAPVLTSDAKFKKNFLEIDAPLSKVLNLQGHSYEWKTAEYPERNFAAGRHYGVIAQEIEKVLPEVVATGADGSKSVAYTEIIPVLIEAIKEQQRQIEELKAQVSTLQH